jgi:hypothetical protein
MWRFELLIREQCRIVELARKRDGINELIILKRNLVNGLM